MNKLWQGRSSLVDRFVYFARWLRQYEFLIGPEETADMFRALDEVDLADEAEVRATLRTVLCSRREEQEIFDDLFERFFRFSESDKALAVSEGNGKRKSNFLSSDSLSPKTVEGNESDEHGADGQGADAFKGTSPDDDQVDDRKEMSFLEAARYSAREWNGMNSIQIPAAGMDEMLSAAKMMVSEIRLKPSRRHRPMARGQRLDFRRTFRRNVQTGTSMIDPVWSGRPKREAEFVLLCDGSRSMLAESEFFLQFACALVREAKRAETFLFSTRLRKITPLLKRNRRGRIPVLADLGMEWGGGTRIGDSLERFVRDFGPQFLNSNTLVFIFSDGLDTGEPGKLEWAMRRIQRQADKIIWLNPLAAADDYEPRAQGMKAALPYVDFFSKAHDASSLCDLARSIRDRRGYR